MWGEGQLEVAFSCNEAYAQVSWKPLNAQRLVASSRLLVAIGSSEYGT